MDSSKPLRRRWFKFRLRAILLLIVAVALASAYVGSYYRLSRRGIHEAAEYGMGAFLYVPMEEARRTEDLATHHRLAQFYAPLNWIDRRCFDGQPASRGILWHLR
jgi:hypothetical protein